ncbi:hypothetical protein MTR67_044387 [Solanum verrucosum]|uniref:DUF4216 domain-containing protein n=1 Tax=Solanum verrucosum TaxID=315347 RepID=A0AAF0ZSW2_SOLVR|nr:hypothetical protein MTR67_044387 [Solanum verrucosum]
MSSKTSVDMRWHKEKHLDEANVLRQPADSEAWKEFDKNHPWFAQEPRNIRLGLATDGFNPFGNMSTLYSMWPVILAPYNLPPWKCLKDPFMIMSLLIPGPQAPGKDIDVYLRPLIYELKELWNDGVDTFDASTGKCFKMHASILWTINDFPAYRNLSGWSTKGYMACPTCNKDASSQKVRNKIFYMGHRRHLEPSHSWRRSKKFDGCVSVDDGKITRLKSHDYHVLLQRVLPIALRGFPNKDVSLALIELGTSEGSIADGYIIDECLTFWSMYLTDIETRFNREHRNDDGSSSKDEHVLDIFSKNSRPFRDGIYDVIPKKDFDMARWFWYEQDSFVLATQAKQVFYIDDPKLGENWRIVLKFQDRHLYDVPEKENSKAESDELHIANYEVYQDISLENNSIVNDSVEILCQLQRDDIDSVTLDANVIELEAQTQHTVEIHYSDDDCNQEDDTIIEYISDHEENEGNNSTNDDEVDSTFDGGDIGL